MIAAMKQATKNGKAFWWAEGEILALEDYENDDKVELCVARGCTYQVIIRSDDQKTFKIKVNYQGFSNVRDSIEINAVRMMFGDTTVESKEKYIIV